MTTVEDDDGDDDDNDGYDVNNRCTYQTTGYTNTFSGSKSQREVLNLK